MNTFLPECMYPDAGRMALGEVMKRIERGEILQSTALSLDADRTLHFEIGGMPAFMPYDRCAFVPAGQEMKPVVAMTRVGQPTCFVAMNTAKQIVPAASQIACMVSRAAAQELCQTEYLDRLNLGDIIPCVVTSIAPFGAFCDVGCGISGLLPISYISVSRISSPAERLTVGQQIWCAVRRRDDTGRLILSMRELLGTWQENVAHGGFEPGKTVVGIVRSVETYGIFIEIAPNLVGLVDTDENDDLTVGQTVSVFIKSVVPEKAKIKMAIVNKNIPGRTMFEPHFFLTSGNIQHWKFTPEGCSKTIETVFNDAAPTA